MTSYSLTVTAVDPMSKNKAKQVIILCHGYGGDGKDISTLAINWRRFLPDAVFLCPDAPEVCNVNPQGFQWFDMSVEKENVILNLSMSSKIKLDCKKINATIEDIDIPWPTKLKPLHK